MKQKETVLHSVVADEASIDLKKFDGVMAKVESTLSKMERLLQSNSDLNDFYRVAASVQAFETGNDWFADIRRTLVDCAKNIEDYMKKAHKELKWARDRIKDDASFVRNM